MSNWRGSSASRFVLLLLGFLQQGEVFLVRIALLAGFAGAMSRNAATVGAFLSTRGCFLAAGLIFGRVSPQKRFTGGQDQSKPDCQQQF
jgi:hypothetical protein